MFPFSLAFLCLTAQPIDAGLPSPPPIAKALHLDEPFQLPEIAPTGQLVESLPKPESGSIPVVAAEPAKPDNKQPSVRWMAQLQADSLWFAQDAASRAAVGDIQDGVVFRRARFGVEGDYGAMEYRVGMDFAFSGRPAFLDVFVGVRDLPYLGRVRVGHFFEPFSLERVTRNRFVTMMERSLPDQPFAPARNLGIMSSRTWLDQRATSAVGLFRTDSDVFGDDVGDLFQSAVTGRITCLPWYRESDGRRYLHLGVAYSFRDAKANSVRFRAQPEARFGAAIPDVPFFVDTGALAAQHFQLVGSEIAAVLGPLSIQAEYVYSPVALAAGGTASFHGWYVLTSLFLTGEHRPYRKDDGTFDRVIPRHDFSPADAETPRGLGAWEVAMRLSQVDLDDGAIRGGRVTNLTAGVNWYMNRYLRVSANYIHSFLVRAPVGRSDTDIFAMRIGYDF